MIVLCYCVIFQILPMSQIRNMLEPSSEVRNLLKKIRKISDLESSKEANFSKFFVAGCVS